MKAHPGCNAHGIMEPVAEVLFGHKGEDYRAEEKRALQAMDLVLPAAKVVKEHRRRKEVLLRGRTVLEATFFKQGRGCIRHCVDENRVQQQRRMLRGLV